MPELNHSCGKRVRFPAGTEGRTGKCPHCGGKVQVPNSGRLPAQTQFELDPPPHWGAYKAYLEDRAPPPRPLVMPKELMLQAEADERWERQAQVRLSKFFCPSCRDRMAIDQVICTKCGLDFRTGMVLGKNQRVTTKGMDYLKTIPWVADARRELKKELSADRLRKKAPRRRKKRRM